LRAIHRYELLSKEVKEENVVHKEIKHAVFYLFYIILFVTMILL
jgi:hypothetical protein